MELALAHPELGYYMNRDPFGARGDFTTAPEISQMFGELIGLWAAEVWVAHGFAEPGPSRRTRPRPRHADERRAARRPHRAGVPRRARRLRWSRRARRWPRSSTSSLLDSGAPIAWAPTLAEVPDGPAIVIANEFLDALPVRQYVRRRRPVARARRCGSTARRASPSTSPTDAGALHPGEGAERRHARDQPAGPPVHVRTRRAAGQAGRRGAVRRLRPRGHRASATRLQAVRAHRHVDPLAAPGECDLTAHVDFAAMARSARAAGAAVYGPIDQGDFLRAIGIDLAHRGARRAGGPGAGGGARGTPRRASSARARARWARCSRRWRSPDRTLPPPPGFQPARGKTA